MLQINRTIREDVCTETTLVFVMFTMHIISKQRRKLFDLTQGQFVLLQEILLKYFLVLLMAY